MKKFYNVFHRSVFISFFFLLVVNKSFAQTTIVNYDFNTGSSFATLNSNAVGGITCNATGTNTGAFITYAGTATGSAFTANTTPGMALGMSNSNGTDTRYFTFTLTGSALPLYNAFKVYFQAQRSNTGASTVTIAYSLNSGAPVSVTTMNPGNGSFAEVTISLPAAANNPTTSLAILLSASGGTGTNGTLRIDNFQIQAVSPNTITTGTITGSPFCVNTVAGASVSVPFTNTGTFPGGNTFTAQLSDATGNFATPVNIGSTSGSGPIAATIPAGTAAGTGYKIRVVGSVPSTTGTANTILTIKDVIADAGMDQIICSGLSTTIGGAIPAAGGTAPYTYAWSAAPADPTLTNVANPNVTPVFSSTNYTLIVTDNAGCASAGDVVNVKTGTNPKVWNGAGVSGGTTGATSTDFNNPNNWLPGGVPGPCNDVTMNISGSFGTDFTVTMTKDDTIKSFTSTFSGFQILSGASVFNLSVGSKKLGILNATNLSVTQSVNFSAFPSIQISVDAGGIVTYTGDLTTSVINKAYVFPFHANTNNTGVFIVRGNATLGGIGNDGSRKPAQVIFDGPTGVTQTLIHNSGSISILFGATSTDIGQSNSPKVVLSGAGTGGYRSIGNLNINNNAKLDVGTQTINRNSVGGSINLAAGTIMFLGGNTGGAPGSNFPSSYSAKNLDPTSTVEYNSGVSDQTIYESPDYGNLTLTGASIKTAAGPLTVVSNLLINSNATFAANGATNWTHNIGGNWTNNGNFTYAGGTTNTINFYGNTDANVTGSSPTGFYSFRISKGVDTTTGVNVLSTVTTATSGSSTLTFTSGKLIIQPGGNFTHNGAGTIISAVSGLHINGGSFKLTDGTVTNNGLLRISSTSGPNNATFGTIAGNSINTGTGGLFDMRGGTLVVAGRLVNTAGTCNISGGSVTLATAGNASSTSTFDMSLSTNMNITGGTITLQNANSSTGYDIKILNSTGIKTFGTGASVPVFIIGNSSTLSPMPGQVFKITSDVPINNLTLFPKNSWTTQLISKPLILKSNLNIQSSAPDTATLDAGTNDIDITLSGSWTNSGKFISGYYPLKTQTVKFNGIGIQTITGNSKTTFNNLIDSNKSATPNNLSMNQNVDLFNAFTFGSFNNATLTIAPGKYFTIKSTINNTGRIGDLTNGGLNSGNKFIFSGSGTGQAQAVIERYFPARRAWRLITAPLAIPTTRTIWSQWQVGQVNVPTTTGSGTYITMSPPANAKMDVSLLPSLKRFDVSSQQLINVLNTDTGLYNIGYFMFIRGDRRPNNLIPYPITNCTETTLRDTGILKLNNITFNASIASGNYVLLPNPYASPVYFGGLTKINIADRFWAWDPRLNNTLGAYALVFKNVLNKYVTTPQCMSCSASQQDSVIQSSQAVFVQANAANPSVTFNEKNKWNVSKGTVFRPASETLPSGSSTFQTVLLLAEPDTIIVADGNYVQFDNRFSDTVDLDDALKFTNFLENFGILRNGKVLTLESRKQIIGTDTVFFKLWNTTARNYRFNFVGEGFDNSGLEAFLEDNYLHSSTEINLKEISSVNFSVTSAQESKATDRFRVVFRPAAGPLPVTFTLLKAYRQNNITNVEWNVENENGIKQYEVERSTDGRTFSKLAAVNAKANNNSASNYQWPDEDAASGKFYYRIKSVSENGDMRYSNIVKVTIGREIPSIVISPNPIIGGTINLQLFNQPKSKYGIRLLNKLGQVIIKKEVEHEEGSSTEILKPGKMLAHGTYVLEVMTPDNKKTNINVIY